MLTVGDAIITVTASRAGRRAYVHVKHRPKTKVDLTQTLWSSEDPG